VTVKNSGTATAPIVFQAATGATVTVTGQADGFSITSLSYITVRGFQVTKTSSDGIYVYGSSHITLDGNDVSYAGQPVSGQTAKGVYITSTTASTIIHNTVHHNTDSGIYLTNGSSGNDINGNVCYSNASQYIRQAPGIDLRNSTNNTIENNVSHDNEDTGVQLYSASNNNLVVNNVMYNNGDHDVDINGCTGNRVIDNSGYKSVASGFNVEGGSTGTTLANNIAVDNAINSPRGVGNIRVDSTSTSGTTIDYDEVFLSVSGQVQVQWNGTSYGTLAAFVAATGKEAHGTEANPLWVSASTGDLHLRAGSPAIDSANSGASGWPATDADGKARVDDPATPNTGAGSVPYADRGAYEYQPSATGATLSGQVFQDTNGNGLKDGGDAGLSGWTVFLDANGNGTLDAGESSAVTDANGNYSFTNLSAGTYRVREVLKSGWTQTTANPADLTLGSSGTASGVNVGDFQNISISGQVFQDTNGNAVPDAGEPVLSGWTVYLDANGNGALDPGEASTTTDAGGSYSFTNVGPGTYTVREVLPAGWTQTTPSPTITAQSGTNVSNVTFGDFQNVSISGTIFNDSNGNGVQDAGEGGLSGWKVQLLNSAGTVVATATTDANGNYSFTNLSAGTYRVREVLKSGWTQTSLNPPDFTVQSGLNVAGVNFGDKRKK